MKISTTELEEFGRKFDVGIGKLGSIEGKLDILADGQDKMLKVLERIEDKL